VNASLSHTTNAWWSLARRAEPIRRRVGLDAAWHAALGTIERAARPGARYLARGIAIESTARALETLSPDALAAQTEDARAMIRRGADDAAALDRALAVLAEHARRTLGLGAHPNQLACALALLDGRIAELATGEGKTLAIALTACVLGWRGRGCHVLTANDYLALRDARDMAPLLLAAGHSVGLVTSTTAEPDRRDAYAASVTYSTAREVAADLLRDSLRSEAPATLAGSLAARMIGGEPGGQAPVLRGLFAAIIDEADALLIDDASMPLILAGVSPTEGDGASAARADAIARDLVPGVHYRAVDRPESIHLTDRGRSAIAESVRTGMGPWASARQREELVELALHARTHLHRDEHYTVIDGKVVIIDPATGRLVPDRSWRAGLHQAVEAKEQVASTSVKETLARTPFQRFFRRYTHLCGTTGTAHEVRHELWQMYHLPVVRLPPNLPCLRTVRHAPILPTTSAMVDAVVDAVRSAHATGRPVLVGTRSVEMSERVSAALTEAGLPHRVLNAVRHAEEAAIVAGAGERSAITIATNMAGRGTDIRLGEGVGALGGLLVVCAETQSSARLERQLLGRSARQGDPGAGIVLRSLDDGVVRIEWPLVARAAHLVPEPVRTGLVRCAQRFSEVRARSARARIARDEDRATETLEFAGAGA